MEKRIERGSGPVTVTEAWEQVTEEERLRELLEADGIKIWFQDASSVPCGPEPWHGSQHGYNRGCRGPACTKARMLHQRENRAGRRSIVYGAVAAQIRSEVFGEDGS